MSQALPIQDPFVGREIEQQRYQEFLTKANPWVMNIIGQGGIGKSTLLRRLGEHTPPEILVVSLNFAACTGYLGYLFQKVSIMALVLATYDIRRAN